MPLQLAGMIAKNVRDLAAASGVVIQPRLAPSNVCGDAASLRTATGRQGKGPRSAPVIPEYRGVTFVDIREHDAQAVLAKVGDFLDADFRLSAGQVLPKWGAGAAGPSWRWGRSEVIADPHAGAASG